MHPCLAKENVVSKSLSFTVTPAYPLPKLQKSACLYLFWQ